MHLAIKVVDVLAVKARPAEDFARKSDEILVRVLRLPGLDLSRLSPSGGELTDEEVVSPAIGKEYVFALEPRYQRPLLPGTGLPKQITTTAWSMTDLNWVNDTLARPAYPSCQEFVTTSTGAK